MCLLCVCGCLFVLSVCVCVCVCVCPLACCCSPPVALFLIFGLSFYHFILFKFGAGSWMNLKGYVRARARSFFILSFDLNNRKADPKVFHSIPLVACCWPEIYTPREK